MTDYTIGIGVRRVQDKTTKQKESDHSSASEDEEETIGIKVIVSNISGIRFQSDL